MMRKRVLRFGLVVAALALVAAWWAAWRVWRRPVSLRIESAPSRAAAYLDGRFLGMTPAPARNVGWGPHVLRLERPGRATYRGAFSASELVGGAWRRWRLLARGGEIARRIKLPPDSAGKLVVSSDPSGARVFLNGKAVGLTPLRLDGVPPGDYAVLLVKKGYTEFSARIRVDPGAETTLRRGLSPLIVPILEARVKKDPTNLHNYVDLAHEYLIRGRHKKAAGLMWRGHKLLVSGKATAGFEDDRLMKRFYYELYQILMKEFEYPAKGSKTLRKAAYDILVAGSKAFPDETSIRGFVKRLDRDGIGG